MRRDALVEKLEFNAGLDPLTDRFNCGYIAAMNDILNISVDEVELND